MGKPLPMRDKNIRKTNNLGKSNTIWFTIVYQVK